MKSMILSDYYLGLGEGAAPAESIVFTKIIDKEGDYIVQKDVPCVEGVLRTQWFELTGTKKSECMLDADWKVHGMYKQWYMEGGLKAIITYNHGTARGPFTMWNKEGVKVVDYTHTSNEDMGCGIYTRWNNQGAKVLETEYVNSKPVHGGYIWTRDGTKTYVSPKGMERIIGVVYED
jgi:antitoxin component YwqK of YwqJK toxin-antitoxin module